MKLSLLFVVLLIACNFAQAQSIAFSSPSLPCGNDVTVRYSPSVCNGTCTWTFEGGNPATATGPGPFLVSWTAAGSHTVTVLEVNGACTHTTNKILTTTLTPDSLESTFTVSPALACVGQNVILAYTGGDDLTVNQISVNWGNASSVNFFASPDSFEVTYAQPATINLSMSITYSSSGCTSPATVIPFTIHAAPSDTFTYSSVGCAEAAVSYTGSASPQATYTWTVDGGGTPIPTGAGPDTIGWPGAGTRNVTLSVTDTNGCSAASPYTLPVTVTGNNYTSPFTALPATVCGTNTPVTITYTGNAPGTADFNWNFNGGTVISGTGAGPYSVSWPTTGSHTISLSVGNGTCTSAITNHSVNVNAIPTSTFTADAVSICIGTNSILTYTGNAGVGATYNWNFDGGTGVPGGTVQGPQTVTWPGANTYAPTLSVTENGCTSGVSLASITVSNLYTSSFTATISVCGPGTAATVTYTGNAPGTAQFNWNFSGGTIISGTGAEPYLVSWPTTGPKTVTLTVGSGSCVSALTTKIVTVSTIPTSSFTVNVDSICVGTNSILTYTGNASAGATYNWNFYSGIANPGGTTEGPQIVTWPGAGTYIPSLTVTENGCVSVITSATIVVGAIPSISVGSNSPVVAGESINLTASAAGATSYQWNGPAGFSSTEQNPTIINSSVANAGTYTVTVNANGCSANDSVVVAVQNGLILSMDTVTGTAGQQVVIIVRVKHFNSLVAAQGTIQFNPAALSFVHAEQFGVDSLTTGSFGTAQAASGLITFAWFDRTLQGVTLPDGSVFFALRFTVSNGGQASAIIFANSPTPQQYIDSALNIVPATLNPGVVNIFSKVIVSGKIKSELGNGIRSTTVIANGNPDFTVITDTTGNYSFSLSQDSVYVVSPFKANDTVAANGVTILDVLLIQRHIAGTMLLSSPYKIIAADVDQSGTITTADINLINSLILGNISSFPNNKLWAFVPANHLFSNPQNPFPYPNSLTYASVSAQSNQDFIGMKLGDVNNNWNPAIARVEGMPVAVQLYTPDVTTQTGAVISVPVKAKNFNNISGFQFTVKWDSSVLSFSKIDSARSNLQALYNFAKAPNGLLTVLWADPSFASTTLPDDSALFYVNFSVTGNTGSSTFVSVVGNPTPIEVVDENLTDDSVDVTSGLVTVATATGVMQPEEINNLKIMPNPFADKTKVQFELSNEQQVKISLVDLLGRQLESQTLQLCSGENEITLTNNFAPGTYYLKITGEHTIKTAKLILLK